MAGFDSFGIGVSGVLYSQAALKTVGNNLANINTEGYSRQRTVFEASRSQRLMGDLQFGTGTNIKEVERIADLFIQENMRQTKSQLGEFESRTATYQEINVNFNETEEGLGLNSSMTAFWNAWSDLASSPTDSAEEAVSKRANVLQATEHMIGSMQETSRSLQNLREQSTQRINAMVSDVNSRLEQLASVNKQIGVSNASGQTAHDLEDKRDMLLSELAERLDVNADIEPNGQASVFIDGKMLVDRNIAYGLRHEQSGQYTGKLMYEGPNYEADITKGIESGSLRAQLDMRDEVIPDYLDRLDELASGIIAEVNRVHSSGMASNPFEALSGQNSAENPSAPINESGLPFEVNEGSFQIRMYSKTGEQLADYEIAVSPDDSLKTIAERIDAVDGLSDGGQFSARVSANGQLEIRGHDNKTFSVYNDDSNFLVATGMNTYFSGSSVEDMAINSYVRDDPSKVAASLTGNAGDNANANRIAELRNERLMGNQDATFDEFYNTTVTRIGLDSSTDSERLEAAEMTFTQLSIKRESISGVNENEELTAMLKYQRAFEASSRFISTLNSIFDNIINRMGV